ncbi:MAG: lipopolysaccharide heptosyltransferase II [Betaproteobacteria bacterium]
MARRVLIVGPSWVGDMVMAQPLAESLATTPDPAMVDMLAPGWVLGMIRRMPGIANAISSPFAHGKLGFGARRALGRQLASHGYDQAIVLPNSFKSALVPWFAGIPRRTGFLGEWRLGLLNDIHPLDRAAVPRLVDRFALLGPRPGSLAPPRLLSPPDTRRETCSRLGIDPERPAVCLCPGAEYGPAKRWPVEHFATLARALAGHGMDIRLLGSARDAPVADAIAAACGHPVSNLCGRTTLEDAVDVLACAQVVVSNDSGLMHVAAAVGRPVIALFGSSSPDYTPPLSERARIMRNPVPCSPCFKRECPLKHFDCLNGLAPRLVLEQVEAALEHTE